jgi:hypothetical protein
MARVMRAADARGRGLLNIAGARIEAELPRHVRAGEQLRLVVKRLDSRRVVLEMPHTTQAVAPHSPAIQLPGGVALRVLPDPERGEEDAGSARQGGSAGSTLALSYETLSLGTLDLRFELDPAGLRVAITAAPGQPLELAGAGAQALQAALEQTGDRPATVSVSPRREPLDVYA